MVFKRLFRLPFTYEEQKAKKGYFWFKENRIIVSRRLVRYFNLNLTLTFLLDRSTFNPTNFQSSARRKFILRDKVPDTSK